MKPEEAIAEIRESGLYGNQVHMETLELALEAIEKQVAKKPNDRQCVDCNHYVIQTDIDVQADIITNVYYDYCPNCGKRQDWSEEE